MDEVERLTRERDFYRRLLDLAHREAIDPLLQEALDLMVEISGASRGYIAIDDPEHWEDEHRFWLGKSCSEDDVRNIRAAISSSIMTEAIACGQTIQSPSAMLDPRFLELGSVRAKRIEAVLCAPIGGRQPFGVLYLQGRAGWGPFSSEAVACAEIFARHLAPIAERILVRLRDKTLDPTAKYRAQLRVEGLIGSSSAMGELLRQIMLIAPLEVDALLTGASGTGKSAVARAIAENSPRASGPFVDLNCAAIPETLMESELFGAVAGAHSTAAGAIPGKVEAARGGTLLLDEVAELSLAAQGKLLQLLQSRAYYPLGAKDPRVADVRIIAATNVDLSAAVAEKRFREDLLYRLQILPIRVPSLSERQDDIPSLLRHFCRQAAERHRLPSLEPSPRAVVAAEAAPWPGNIRQLEHAAEAALIRAAGDGDGAVEAKHLFPGAPPESVSQQMTFQEATREFQKKYLRDTLRRNNWNITKTSKDLDVARAHVYNLIHAFELERPLPRGSDRI